MTDTRSPDAEPEQDEWVPVPPAFHITNVPRSPDAAYESRSMKRRLDVTDPTRSPDPVEARKAMLRETPHRERLMRVVDRVAPFGMLRDELLDCIFDIEAAALAAALRSRP